MISKCIIGAAGGLSPFCAVYPHDHHPLWSQHIIHLFLKLPQQLWVKLLLWSGPKCLENPTEGKLTWDSKATGTAQWTQNQQKKVTQTLHFPSLNLPKEGSLGRPIFLLGQVQICLTTLGKLDTTSKGDELGVLPVKSNQEHCHFWDSSFHQKIL